MNHGPQEGPYKCWVASKAPQMCQDIHPHSKKNKYTPLCGCYFLCQSCVDIFFAREDGVVSCDYCKFEATKDFFVPLATEGEEYERANNRANKVFNHPRNQIEGLQKYNDYVETKLEIAYKLFAKIDLKETEASLASFELKNGPSIAKNNSEPQYENKNAYILEEFKRVSKIKIQKERLVDRYYRSYIDEKGFAAETQALLSENSATPVQNLIATEIKATGTYSYKPNSSQSQLQSNQKFEFPKPILSEAARKMEREEVAKGMNEEDISVSKEAGGWTTNILVARCKENAFRCLFQ
jgi:hypothetical protein